MILKDGQEKVVLIEIANNHQEIIFTNYWDSEHAKKGFFYVSINAGAFRLLTPDSQLPIINEMKTAEYAVISRGPWPEQRKSDGIEIMFEDHTSTPYTIHMLVEQFDLLPATKDVDKEWLLSVWTRSGKQLEMPCYYRKVKEIPWLKPYKKGDK